MFRNLWIAFICMSVLCDCPLIVAQSHQETDSIKPTPDNVPPPWKATEGSRLWNIMHARVKLSFWGGDDLQSLLKPRSDSPDLLNAKSVAIITLGPSQHRFLTWWGKQYFLPNGANVIRDRETLETEIRKWNQYTLVEDPERADLVIAFRGWDHNDCPGRCLGVGASGWTGSQLLVFKGGSEFEEKAEVFWAEQEDWIRDNAYEYAAMLICSFRDTVEKLSKRQGLLRSQSPGRCSVDAYRDAVPYWELPEGNPLREKMYEEHFNDIHPDAKSFRKIRTQGQELLTAKSVAIVIFGHGHPSFKYLEYETPNALEAKDTVEKQIKKRNYYSLVDDPRDADLVIALRVWTEG